MSSSQAGYPALNYPHATLKVTSLHPDIRQYMISDLVNTTKLIL